MAEALGYGGPFDTAGWPLRAQLALLDITETSPLDRLREWQPAGPRKWRVTDPCRDAYQPGLSPRTAGVYLMGTDDTLGLVGTISRLEREMYTEADAARLLRVPQSTLHYWLEGGVRGRRSYRPIIRPEPKGVRTVTWAEFIESGWLREYRAERVPMLELRLFIDEMRSRFGVPWPLADRRPLVSGRQLVFEAQEAAGLDPEYYLVTAAGAQMILTGPGLNFFHRVEFDGDVAAGYRPDSDPDSPVRILADVRFGKPSVGGISTEVIYEHSEVGEDVEEIARTFRLEPSEVRWALAYEYAQQTAA